MLERLNVWIRRFAIIAALSVWAFVWGCPPKVGRSRNSNRSNMLNLHIRQRTGGALFAMSQWRTPKGRARRRDGWLRGLHIRQWACGALLDNVAKKNSTGACPRVCCFCVYFSSNGRKAVGRWVFCLLSVRQIVDRCSSYKRPTFGGLARALPSLHQTASSVVGIWMLDFLVFLAQDLTLGGQV